TAAPASVLPSADVSWNAMAATSAHAVSPAWAAPSSSACRCATWYSPWMETERMTARSSIGGRQAGGAASLIRLLFVEDDEDDFLLTSELLQQSELLRFHVDWVSSVEAARQALAENRHDICLMDYRLGTEVGITLVREAMRLGFSA